MDLTAIRQDYSKQELSPEHCLADPIAQFELWMQQALAAKVAEPTAMHLATVDAQGRPSARIVLLKAVEHRQFVFYTNYDSRKGQQLAHNPAVALTFFWPDLERQVRIEGDVSKVADDVSDAYFYSRPYTSRIGAWASAQSQAVDSKTTLMKRAAELALKYITDVPRPPFWGGFAVTPQRIEFWQGRPSRLHDRVLYQRDDTAQWTRVRLSP